MEAEASVEKTAATLGERALVILTIAGLAIIPLIFGVRLEEMFRSVKEAAMRVQAVLSVFALVAAVTYGASARLRELLRARKVVAFIAAIILWTAITAMTSTQRALSIESLITVICSALLFFCIWFAAPRVPLALLLILVPVVIANAAVATLQETAIWNPFHFTLFTEGHLTATGFIGNPNDVGAYLALCTIVLLIACEFLRGWQRWLCAFGAAIALGGVFVSQARTAVIATAAGLIVIALRWSFKAASAIIALLIVALIAATMTNVPALTRLAELPKHAAAGQWDLVFSDRLPPFLAAVEMFRDHPLTGAGPGTYKFNYMRYRTMLADRYPPSILHASGENFSDTHNDHLQVLAETGVIGYALFLAALVILASKWKRDSTADDDRVRFAQSLGFPLAATLFVLALAFFPLQIAATRHLLVTIGALIIGWRES